MNKKGLLAGALVVVSVAAISIGSTFALLKDTTEAKVNVFTAAAGLEGQLKEDAFDGCDYGVARPDTFTDESLGIVKAQKVVPGRAIPKDPQVKNNSDASKGVSAWVAIKLEVKCDGKTGSDAMNEIKKFADINFSDTWEAAADGITFYYKTAGAPQGETTALFTTVTIKDDDTISVADIKDFELNPTAYLVQAEGAEGATTLEAAKAMFAATFPAVFGA